MLNENLLKETVWMQHLSPEQRTWVFKHLREKNVPAGGVVCRKGEAVNDWIGVVSGLVKINNLSADGKSVTFTGVPSGGWFGEGSLLKTELRRYDVTALRDSKIAFMPRDIFTQLLETSLPFTRFLLSQLNERLAQFISTVENDRLLSVDARVARCLAALFNPILYPGSSTQLQISQEEVGYLSGTSRQRANQALQTLERERLLKLEYGAIKILDLDGLRQYDVAS